MTAASNQDYATSSATSTADNLRVLKAGDTMTGVLQINTGSANGYLQLSRAAGFQTGVDFETGGLSRFSLGVTSAAESGSNAGSDFYLNRSTDAGGFLATALSIKRSTGDITFGGSVVVDSAVPSPAPAALSLYGGHISGAQLMGWNAYFAADSTWRARATGHCGAMNFDKASGDFYLSLTNASTTAGAAPTLTNRMQLSNTGGSYNTTGTWSAISDAALKTEIQPYPRGLPEILALNPCSFRYVEGAPFAGPDDPVRYGLIAQEVQPHVPEAVGSYTHTPEKGAPVELLTIDPGHMVYPLINAIKQLKAELDELKARLEP